MSMSQWRATSEELFPKGENPFGNKFYGYRKTALDLPDGRNATYHGVLVSPCVHVVALENDETTYLVRQSRPNARQIGELAVPITLELPGGFGDENDLEGSARTELREEVHRDAGTLEHIGTLYPSSGVSNEQDHIFMGTDLSAAPGYSSGEATEFDMDVVTGKFGTLYTDMLHQKTPVSAQTLAAMAMVAVRL
jgi:hypothetical protein